MGVYRKGLVLTLGAINVIVSVDGMKDRDTALTSVCCGPASGTAHAPTQIKQQMHCSTCDDVVAFADIKKAQVQGDQFVVVDADEVATVRDSTLGATKKMMQILVRDAEEVASKMLQGDSVYAVIPEGAAQTPAYSLIYDTIERHPEFAFMTQWTPASKLSPYQLKTFNGGIVMSQLCVPEAVREMPTMNLIEVLPEHQAMVDTLLPSICDAFDPADFADHYKTSLGNLLASKAAVDGITLERSKSAPKTASTSGGVDLTAALGAMLGNLAATPTSPPTTPVRTKAPRARKTA